MWNLLFILVMTEKLSDRYIFLNVDGFIFINYCLLIPKTFNPGHTATCRF